MHLNIRNLFKCPDCGGKMRADLICDHCARVYQQIETIYHLMPRISEFPDLAVYRDPDYLKYNALLSQTDDYFYRNKNPMINWVQCSGYKVIKKFLGAADGAILECGGGTGVFLDIHGSIAKDRYVITDIDEGSLLKIKDKEALGGIVKSTIYKLPFLDHSFDIIISHAQLEHLPYLDHALQEITRVLKPSGVFLASVPNEGGLLWTKGRDVTSAKYFGKEHGINYIRANRIDHFNTVHQIDRSLRRHFTVDRREFFPFGFSSFDWNFTTTYALRPARSITSAC